MVEPCLTFPPFPASLVDGVEEAVCAALRIVRLRHRSALPSLKMPMTVDLPALVYRTIANNWLLGRAADNRDRSRQNWRWALQEQIASGNRSPEVRLERAIAAAAREADRDDWANQIPVASGLIVGAPDRRRAIDLAHRLGARAYALIELKIASDTPLYAAVELLTYASIWLLARNDPPAARPDLLDAEKIELRVLAPAAFYAPFALFPLERSISHAVASLGQQQGVTMSFAFDVLPVLAPDCHGATLLAAMDARMPLHGHA